MTGPARSDRWHPPSRGGRSPRVPALLRAVDAGMQGLGRGATALLVVALLLAVVAVDYATGPEIALSILYLVPVALASWYLGWNAGFLVMVSATLGWFVADWLAGAVYRMPGTRFWNAGVRGGFFFLVAYMLTALQAALEKERGLARTDVLTGLPNARSFLELLERETVRAGRYGHAVSVAYLDVDDFKLVNDRYGHAAGDELLQAVAEGARGGVRDVDVVARLGGDEFALLLPEADAEGARVVVGRVARDLRDAAVRAGWPVNFSIGVAVFTYVPAHAEAMVQAADRLMYQVKQAGKGSERFQVFATEAELRGEPEAPDTAAGDRSGGGSQPGRVA